MKLTIVNKLRLLALSISIIFIVVIFLMRGATSVVESHFNSFYDKDFESFLNFSHVKALQIDTALSVRGLQIAYLLGINDQAADHIRVIKQNSVQTPLLLQRLGESTATAQRPQFQKLAELVGVFQKRTDAFVTAMQEAPNNRAPYPIFLAFSNSYKALNGYIETYEQALRSSAADTKTSINKSIERANLIFYISLLIGIVVAAVVSQWVASVISKGIYAVRETAEKLAQGSLISHADVTSHDEVKDLSLSINATIERLRDTIGAILSSSQVVSDNSDVVLSLNKAVHDNAQDISDNTNQAAAAIEEMSLTSQNIAQNTTSTAASTDAIKQWADQCLTASNESVNEIERLLTSFTETNAKVSNLQVQTEGITTILDVIKAISDQTNLLALNAAIEAARAGEQGRGFSVVADEVRQLAGRSHESVNQIESMLSQLVEAANSTAVEMQESDKLAGSLKQRVLVSNDMIVEIQKKLEEVNDQTQEVAAAAEEQSMVVNEISENMHRIKSLVEDNAQTVADSNNKSLEMKSSADQVNVQLAFFKTS